MGVVVALSCLALGWLAGPWIGLITLAALVIVCVPD